MNVYLSRMMGSQVGENGTLGKGDGSDASFHSFSSTRVAKTVPLLGIFSRRVRFLFIFLFFSSWRCGFPHATDAPAVELLTPAFEDCL